MKWCYHLPLLANCLLAASKSLLLGCIVVTCSIATSHEYVWNLFNSFENQWNQGKTSGFKIHIPILGITKGSYQLPKRSVSNQQNGICTGIVEWNGMVEWPNSKTNGKFYLLSKACWLWLTYACLISNSRSP